MTETFKLRLVMTQWHLIKATMLRERMGGGVLEIQLPEYKK